MTSHSPTPETDSATWVCYIPDASWDCEVVKAEFSAALERDRDRLAAQVKALREALWNIMSGVDDHIKAGKIECRSCASNVAEARKALDSTR